jgi:hypothetical protein
MTLDDVIKNTTLVEEQWANDSVIDETILNTESCIRTGKLHSKYYSLFMKEKRNLTQIELEYSKLRQRKYEFFLYGATKETIELGWEIPPKVPLKTEISNVIDAENDIQQLILLLNTQKTLVQFLNDIIKMIAGRSFQIRDAIEWSKFVNAVN